MSSQNIFCEPDVVFSVENFNCWGRGKSEVILYSDGQLQTVDNRETRTVVATDVGLARDVESFILENSKRILQLPDSDSSGMCFNDLCPHNLNFRGKKCSAYVRAAPGNEELKYFYDEISRIIREHGYLKDHPLIKSKD